MTSRRIVKISYFAMLTIIGGLIRLPIPGTPIMFTLQTLFVVMSGFFLGCYDGAFSQIVYMLLGLLGLPVFTKGGGLWYIFEPSFGYIFSFFIVSFVTGFAMRRLKTVSVFKIFCCGMAGVLINYAIGISYQVMILTLVSGSTLAAALATVPSVLIMFVKDCVLLFLLCLIYPRLMTMMKINEKKAMPVMGEFPPKKEESGEKKENKEKKKKKEEAGATSNS